MIEELLPIGSVVRLKHGSKRIMICGRIQERLEDGRVFDYSASYFPEGILDPEQLFLFDHQDVEEVIARGYEDEEERAFRGFLMNHKTKQQVS